MTLNWRYAWPDGRAAQWAAFLVLVGGLVGYLTHPLCWLVGGPVRWVCLLMMTASGESAFNPTAIGDGGASVGILQFNVGNDSIPLDKRSDAFWSGYGAAVNVQAAILKRWGWFPRLACPIIGPAWFRALWYGPTSIDTLSTAEVWARFADRPELPRSWSAWWFWRGATMPLAVLLTVSGVPALASFLGTLPVLAAVRKWGRKWRR